MFTTLRNGLSVAQRYYFVFLCLGHLPLFALSLTVGGGRWCNAVGVVLMRDSRAPNPYFTNFACKGTKNILYMQIYLHLGMGFSVRGLYVLQWADFRVEMMKPRRVEQKWLFGLGFSGVGAWWRKCLR